MGSVGLLCQHEAMSIIKINAITVAADSGDELAKRFAARAGAVDDQDGFEGFELLQPTDGRTTWLVITRWRDEEAFTAWASSPAFGQGHRSEGSQSQTSVDEQARKPVGVSSELWSYVTAGGTRFQDR
jgi:heme-degrading monooxygenase HmoA